MLVVRPKGRTAGVRVDRVREFVSIPATAIRVPGTEEQGGNRGLIDRFVEGIATIGKRVVLILNIDEVLEEA
jgi:purine-binding chemotaxis protein CheW